MIKPEDAEFHTPPDDDYRWCETNPFLFNLPEHGIAGVIYTVTRPVLGVCMGDVTLYDRISHHWDAQLYIDNQQHMPCPASLLEYDLPNGVSVRAVKPLEHYTAHYEGIDDTHIDIEFKALMAPYDMNDPDMDPLASARQDAGWNKAFGGHYEQTGRVTGEMVVRGKHYTIDCIDTVDRSWGPRAERDNAAVVWLHASFGERLTIHVLCAFDPATSSAFGPLISGYVLEDGEVHGISGLEGHSERSGLLPMSTKLKVTDVRGKSFAMTAAAVNGSPWAPYPSLVYVQNLMRWNLDGEIGYGVQQDVMSRAYLTRHRDALRHG